MSNACRTCGEKSFSVESGVKTCNFCGTEEIGFLELESQEILSQVEYSRLIRIKKKELDPSSEVNILNNWTTYEAFNITLFEWTQALRAAEVSKDFQEIVFKLWVTYLQKMEVAFMAEAEQDENWKSKATLLETNRNIQIIHNEQETIDKRTKKKKKKKKKHQTNLERIQENVVKQKNLYKGKSSLRYLIGEFNKTLTELDADSTGIDNNVCPVLEEDTSKVEPKTSAVRKCQLVHNTTASRVLKKRRRETKQEYSDEQKIDELQSADDTNSRADTQDINLSRNYVQRKMPFQLNFKKILGLLYLAVLLSEEDILLMDMIRWCREGHIPYLSAPNLLKQDMGLLEKDRYMLFSIRDVPSSDIIQEISGKLALFLSIQYIPLPKEDLIISRIVDILKLPVTVGTVAKQFMGSVHKRPAKYTPSIPEVEIRAVAAVICSVKLYCGLDDWQEVKLSKAAKMINKQLRWSSSKQVFNWDEWERYMETLLWVCCKVNVVFATQCRKYDLAEFITSTNICEHFWQEGIWRKAKFSSNKGHKDQDYKIMQKLLELKGTPLEDVVDQQNILRMSKDPFMDIVKHFLKKYENSEHEDVQDLLMVARRLQNKSFTCHDISWPAHLKEIQEELNKVGSSICLRPEPTHDFPVIQDSKKEKLFIPQPHKYGWKYQMTPENIKMLPKSFLWLVSLGALIVETDKIRIMQHINSISKTDDSNNPT